MPLKENSCIDSSYILKEELASYSPSSGIILLKCLSPPSVQLYLRPYVCRAGRTEGLYEAVHGMTSWPSFSCYDIGS